MFSLSTPSNISFSMTTSSTGPTTSLALYQGTVDASGSIIGVLEQASSVGVTGTSAAITFSNLAKGTYVLALSESAALLTGQGASVSARISAVPLPGALALFGSGLVGLFVRSRTNKATKRS